MKQTEHLKGMKPSEEKVWLKWYPEGAADAPLTEMSIYEYLYENNKRHLKDVALEYYGNKISFGELFENIENSAKALKLYGVEQGDIVTLCMPSTPEMIYVFYALNKIGATANMVSPAFDIEQVNKHITSTDSKIVMTLDKFCPKIIKAIDNSDVETVIVSTATESLTPLVRVLKGLKDKKEKVVKPDIPYGDNVEHDDISAEIISWNDFLKSGKSSHISNTTAVVNKNDVAALVYSSGSTGSSKAIQLSNFSFNATVNEHEVMGKNIHRNQKLLNIIPSFFSTGISISMHLPLCMGLTVQLDPVFDKNGFAKQIKKYKPQMMVAPTSHWEAILSNPDLDKVDLSFITYPLAGGEALPERLAELLNSFFAAHSAENVKMHTGYGMCELGSGLTTSNDYMNRLGSTGIPMPHAIVGSFDIDTQEELGYNERGEICAITPMAMNGYYKNEEATKEFFKTHKDGKVWCHTGDIGYIDEDGNVFVEGRAKDSILGPNNETIYLFDAEKAILDGKTVKAVEVVGIKNNDKQVPVAHLVLNPEYKGNKDEAIIAANKRCEEILPDYEVPVGFKVRDAFGVTPGGKRDTKELINERTGYFKPNDDGMLKVVIPEKGSIVSDYVNRYDKNVFDVNQIKSTKEKSKNDIK